MIFPGKFRGRLPLVFAAGAVLALLITGGMVFLALYGGGSLFPPGKGREEDTFARGLREYDALLAAFSKGGAEKPESLLEHLARLEKKALGVESRLSLLKRRRRLARLSPEFLPPYRKAAFEAAAAFPFSEPLAAVAAEALILDDAPMAGEKAERLRDYAGRISQARLAPLAASARILTGDMAGPEKAAAIPRGEALLSSLIPYLSADQAAPLLIDGEILRLLQGDMAGAAVRINALIENAAGEASKNTPKAKNQITWFGAEFFYDYGNPRRAAELFSLLTAAGWQDLVRQADALALAGETGGARNIWSIIAMPDRQGQPSLSAGISGNHILRSLYNLAASAPDEAEAEAWLGRFFAARTQYSLTEGFYGGSGGEEPAVIYGIIRYTRLLDAARSMAILEEGDLRKSPLPDLEFVRRRLSAIPPDRAAAEVWLLLGRHPGDEQLYRWGAYYFDRQRLYTETAQLMKSAAYHQLSAPWIDLHESVRLLREGKTDEGEKLLRAAADSDLWQIPANIGRILESRRSVSAALEYYETAASLVKNRASASLVQMRIGRCLQALGRGAESRRVLQYALDLNPDNLSARHELRRLDAQGVY